MKTDMSNMNEKKNLSPEFDHRSKLTKTLQRTKQRQECSEEDCPSENEHEFESLEYEEDAYYSNLTATPSFDDIDEHCDGSDEIIVHCWRDSNGDIDEIVVDDANLSIETEFLQPEAGGGFRNRGRKKKQSVRVIFQDFSKPYLAKISNSQNYKKFLELVKGAGCTRLLMKLKYHILVQLSRKNGYFLS